MLGGKIHRVPLGFVDERNRVTQVRKESVQVGTQFADSTS
jgi:hypothetical protein